MFINWEYKYKKKQDFIDTIESYLFLNNINTTSLKFTRLSKSGWIFQNDEVYFLVLYDTILIDFNKTTRDIKINAQYESNTTKEKINSFFCDYNVKSYIKQYNFNFYLIKDYIKSKKDLKNKLDNNIITPCYNIIETNLNNL